MAYNPADMEDLTTITGDEDANQFADIDPLGGAIFGWGNRAYNNEIKRKNAQMAKLRSQIGQERFGAIKDTVGQNAEDWANLGLDIFGQDGNKLEDFYGGVQESDQAALRDLLGSLGDFTNAADFFNDPRFMGDVGDVTNAAVPSGETLANQKDAIGQFRALTTPKETAEEKFQRAMAQREMEANLKGDREALARSLKARGTYGSGAELVGNLMSQGQQADRLSMANLAANAGAQKRALAALGSYADMSGRMRQAETQEGALANSVAQFNNQVNQSTANQRAAAQVGATQAGEAAKQQRAVQGFTGTTNVNNAARGDTRDVNQTKTGFVQGQTGNRTQGTGLLAGAYDKEDDYLKNAMAANAAQHKTSLLGIG